MTDRPRRLMPTTVMELVKRLAADGEVSAEDLDTFANEYQSPIYRYFVRLAHDPEWAQDLAQQFFHDKVLTRKLFRSFETGRVAGFRPYLKAALRNFWRDAFGRAQGREIPMAEPPLTAQAENAAEDAFTAEWGRNLLSEALRDTAITYERKNKSDQYRIFVAYHLGERADASWVAIGRRFGLSADQARTRAGTVRNHFRRALRTLIFNRRENGESVDSVIETLLSTNLGFVGDDGVATDDRLTDDGLRALLELGSFAADDGASLPAILGNADRLPRALDELTAGGVPSGSELLRQATEEDVAPTTLEGIKGSAKGLQRNAVTEEQRAAAALLYHTAVAAALVRHRLNISTHSPRRRADLYVEIAKTLDDSTLSALFQAAAQQAQ